MCGADDHWVKAAMADDTVVVDLLLRLHGAPPKNSILKPLEWTVRQRRSSSGHKQRKQGQRASPTTPLSWSASGASGGSGGVGGDEESSHPPMQSVSASARSNSKVSGEGQKTASKRSRKKKTLTELRDEERSLLKERKDLKRDIAALRVNLEKQWMTNEKLKRMKIESQSLTDTSIAMESVLVSDQLHQKMSECHPMLPTVSGNGVMAQPSTSTVHPVQEPNATSDIKFVLPDLNLPLDDNPCAEAMRRVSQLDHQTGSCS